MNEEINKTEKEWKEVLSDEEYKVLRKKGTERAFSGKYHDNKEAGKYLCAGCKAELFDSETKFDSGTGWPSFYDASKENIDMKPDNGLFMRRTEVFCKRCGGHLGHVFEDGPQPTGKRFCINSAALNFEKKEENKESEKEKN